MYSFQEMITKLVYTIASAVFDPIFIIIVYITYLFYKKNTEIETKVLSFAQESIVSKVADAVLHGIMIGILGSMLMLIVDLPLEVTKASALLLPIALMLSLKNPRFACFSYASTILGCIQLLFAGKSVLGITIPNFTFDIPGMVGLVGILHLMEAVLVYLTGAEDSIPVMVRRNNTMVGAYLMQKYWPIPIALLTTQVFPEIKYLLYPMCGILGFGSIAVTTTPEKKSRTMAIAIGIYAIILLVGAMIASENSILQVVILLLMPLLHEFVYYIDYYSERNKQPIYVAPPTGIRVFDVIHNSPGGEMGIERGDIILRINNIAIESMSQYYEMMKRGHNTLWLDIKKMNGKREKLEYTSHDTEVTELGIVPLPRYSIFIYEISRK